jgi:hypothetical protein
MTTPISPNLAPNIPGIPPRVVDTNTAMIGFERSCA